MKLTKLQANAIFVLAGIEVLDIRALIDGYGYEPEDPRYYDTPPRCVWWFVKTKAGWIEIGWRKRVISIDWKDTSIKRIITSDDVTKGDTYVHAWSTEKAVEYMRALSQLIEDK